MANDIDSELIAEIEAFRAELRLRAEQHALAARRPNPLDVPPINSSGLDLPEIRALISQRYEGVRFEKRLRDVERRLADLEARSG